jgi:molybdenum cofactor cytidylyltransferase
MNVQRFAVIILAGGSSSRLGSPKQWLLYKGKSLLQHAIDEAITAGADQVIVVTGALQMNDVDQGYVQIVRNEHWEEGMASSIRCGIQSLEHFADVDAAIIMVCDQPYADHSVLKGILHQQHISGKPIVASEYGGRAGTPALFHRSFFDRLMQLKGDIGARYLIAEHKELAAFLDFPKGITDIDTMRDYESISAEKKHDDQGRI